MDCIYSTFDLEFLVQRVFKKVCSKGITQLGCFCGIQETYIVVRYVGNVEWIFFYICRYPNSGKRCHAGGESYLVSVGHSLIFSHRSKMFIYMSEMCTIAKHSNESIYI